MNRIKTLLITYSTPSSFNVQINTQTELVIQFLHVNSISSIFFFVIRDATTYLKIILPNHPAIYMITLQKGVILFHTWLKKYISETDVLELSDLWNEKIFSNEWQTIHNEFHNVCMMFTDYTYLYIIWNMTLFCFFQTRILKQRRCKQHMHILDVRLILLLSLLHIAGVTQAL